MTIPTTIALFVSVAQAAEQELVYAITLNGADAGERVVTLKTMEPPPAARESAGMAPEPVRMVEAVTRISGHTPWSKVRFSQRATARVGDTLAVTSSVELNGELFELQVNREASTGAWRITRLVEDQDPVRHRYNSGDITMTSVELLAEGAVGRLRDLDQATLIVLETGEVAAGLVGVEDGVSVEVGGELRTATRLRWTAPGTTIAATWDDATGLALAARIDWKGQRLEATLKALPPPPNYGEIQDVESASGMSEETL